MDIDKTAEDIYDFQKRRTSELGATLTPEITFIHLTEEIGEIARQLLNKEVPKFREFDEKNLKEEIAQAILDLLLLSKFFDITPSSEIEKKIKEMKKRAAENN